MSDLIIPLPKSVRLLADQVEHPGLYLDKFVKSWSESTTGKLGEEVQTPAVNKLVELSQSPPGRLDYETIVEQRRRTLQRLPRACVFTAVNTAPIALHLSRGTALENAGIALHPIYGCAHLPGTGIKGLAHAFACEVWFVAQPETKREEAWREICRVFGTAPSPWLNQLARRLGRPKPKTARAGSVVFHDAWGVKWPKLQADVVTSHHKNYYAASKNSPVPEPGDWENPNPVAFPVVAPNQEFEFTLSTRRDDASPSDLELAQAWLLGGLIRFGFGGKTNAGYGTFSIRTGSEAAVSQADVAWQGAVASGAVAASSARAIELVAPAFIGGLNQFNQALSPDETTFRAGSLRGQLRTWWRTMHASHLEPRELRMLEAFIWGDTERSGAVRISVTPQGTLKPRLFNCDEMVADRNNQITKPLGDKKTTWGLKYHSFGMDDHKGRRYFLPVGSRAEITVSARDDRFEEHPIPAPLLVQEAEAALALFAEFGGWGAKSGRAFGSFRFLSERPGDMGVEKLLDDLRMRAREFRARCGLRDASRRPTSLSIDHMLPIIQIDTPWLNEWYALDRIGMAAQLFAKTQKHRNEKKALGLPRNVKSSNPRAGFNPPGEIADRHNGPIRYRLRKKADGTFSVLIAPFIAGALPNYETSKLYLQTAVTEIVANLRKLITEAPQAGRTKAVLTAPVAAPAARSPGLPKGGDEVDVRLSKERTKKGGRIAVHEKSGLSGPIVNSQDVPDSYVDGMETKLLVNACNGKEISFRYQSAVPATKPNKNPKK